MSKSAVEQRLDVVGIPGDRGAEPLDGVEVVARVVVGPAQRGEDLREVLKAPIAHLRLVRAHGLLERPKLLVDGPDVKLCARPAGAQFVGPAQRIKGLLEVAKLVPRHAEVVPGGLILRIGRYSGLKPSDGFLVRSFFESAHTFGEIGADLLRSGGSARKQNRQQHGRGKGHGGHAPADHALPRAHETRQHQIAAPVHSGTGWPQDASRVKSNLRTDRARRGAG